MRHLLLASTRVLLAGCNPGSDGSAGPDPQAAAHADEGWRPEIRLPDNVLSVRLHLASDFGSVWLENGPERATIAGIGRSGRVRRIHAGFSGPGTGAGYSRLVSEFGQTMTGLLGENRGSEQ